MGPVQVLDECQAALGWLEEKKGLQETMKKTDDPVLVTADIKKKEETLARVAEPILSKPPPKKVSHHSQDPAIVFGLPAEMLWVACGDALGCLLKCRTTLGLLASPT